MLRSIFTGLFVLLSINLFGQVKTGQLNFTSNTAGTTLMTDASGKSVEVEATSACVGENLVITYRNPVTNSVIHSETYLGVCSTDHPNDPFTFSGAIVGTDSVFTGSHTDNQGNAVPFTFTVPIPCTPPVIPATSFVVSGDYGITTSYHVGNDCALITDVDSVYIECEVPVRPASTNVVTGDYSINTIYVLGVDCTWEANIDSVFIPCTPIAAPVNTSVALGDTARVNTTYFLGDNCTWIADIDTVSIDLQNRVLAQTTVSDNDVSNHPANLSEWRDIEFRGENDVADALDTQEAGIAQEVYQNVDISGDDLRVETIVEDWTANTIWVDAFNGNDATAEPYRRDKPFRTIVNAWGQTDKTGAVNGEDVIKVLAGDYSYRVTVAAGQILNIDADAGVNLITGRLVNNGGTLKITGKPNLIGTGQFGQGINTVGFGKSHLELGVIRLTDGAQAVMSATTSGAVADGSVVYLSFDELHNTVSALNGSVLYVEGQYADAEFSNSNFGIFYSNSDVTKKSEIHVSIKEALNDKAGDYRTTSVFQSRHSSEIWVDTQESVSTNGSVVAVVNSLANGFGTIANLISGRLISNGATGTIGHQGAGDLRINSAVTLLQNGSAAYTIGSEVTAGSQNLAIRLYTIVAANKGIEASIDQSIVTPAPSALFVDPTVQ